MEKRGGAPTQIQVTCTPKGKAGEFKAAYLLFTSSFGFASRGALARKGVLDGMHAPVRCPTRGRRLLHAPTEKTRKTS